MIQRSLFHAPPVSSTLPAPLAAPASVPAPGAVGAADPAPLPAGSAFVPLALFDSGPASRPPGLARLAAEAPGLDARNEVEYRDLPCRTLLSRCESERVPFAFTINPYRGCEFGCAYCYARYTHEYLELEEWLDFERKIFVKTGGREALLRDLRRIDARGRWIAIGTATDPYQPAERRYRLTRSLLEVLAGRRTLQLSVTTKSDLVTRDIDLLRRIAEHSDVHVNMTITTPHHELARRLEPRAPRPDLRLRAVRLLTDAGVRAGVFVMPVLPFINDRSEDLELLVRGAAEAGAAYLASGVLFLRKSSRKRFMPFIEQEFPELLPDYRRLFGSRGAEALGAYGSRVGEEIAALKQRYNLAGLRRGPRSPAYEPDQLTLL